MEIVFNSFLLSVYLTAKINEKLPQARTVRCQRPRDHVLRRHVQGTI